MMTKHTQLDCPPKTSLSSFVLGKLPESEALTVEQHLSLCEPCNDTLRLLDDSDTFVDLAQAGLQALGDQKPQNADDNQFIEDLINNLSDPERLKSQYESDRSLDSRAAEVTCLLEPTDHPGELGRLGGYRIEKLIGAGATGVVYRALDEQLDRPVALKVLRPSLGENARQRFIAEARATAALDHENVVTIYQVGSTNNLAFIAMQWLPGETLEQRLQTQPILSPELVAQLGKQIAVGLAAAHDKGLIHRDIKPANIWIESNRQRIKILDFGLARVTDEATKVTETGLIAGTPNYMSPEQSRGENLDTRTDLFSLGCVLFQAATGKPPFHADNVLGTLQAIQNIDPPAAHEANPDIPEDLSNLIDCLLEKNPVHRPSGANAVASAFEKPMEQWSFRHRPKNQLAAKADTDAKYRRRSTRSWIIAAALLPLILLAVWFAGPQIIRIATDTGIIEIRTDDPNVKVEIRQNGKLVELVDLDTKQKIVIKSGEYSIIPQSDKNGFHLSANKVIMTRGGKQIVEIKRLPKAEMKDDLSVAKKSFPDKKPAPTFDGRTRKQIIAAMQTERSVQKVADFVKGLQLLTHTPAEKRENTEIFRQLVRKYGMSSLEMSVPRTSEKHFDQRVADLDSRAILLQRIMTMYDRAFDFEQCCEFITTEIAEGTPASRLFLFPMLELTGRKKRNFDNDSRSQQLLSKILDGLLALNQTGTVAEQSWVSSFMLKLLTTCKFEVAQKQLVIEILMKRMEVIPKLSQVKLEQVKDFREPASQGKLVDLAELGLLLVTLNRLEHVPDRQVGFCQYVLHNAWRCNYYTRLRAIRLYAAMPEHQRVSILDDLMQCLQYRRANDSEKTRILQEALRLKDAIIQSDKAKLKIYKLAIKECVLIATIDQIGPMKELVNAIDKKLGSASDDSPAWVKYDGKSFDQWQSALEGEREISRIRECIDAYRVLGNDQNRKAILSDCSKLLRSYGSRTFNDESRGLLQAMIKLFASIPPQDITDFVIQEIETGNTKTRESLFLFLSIPYLDANQNVIQEKYDALEKTHIENIDRFTTVISKIYQDKNTDNSKWATRYLANLLRVIDVGKVKKWDNRKTANSIVEAGIQLQQDTVDLENMIIAVSKMSPKSPYLLPTSINAIKARNKSNKTTIARIQDYVATTASQTIMEMSDLKSTKPAIGPMTQLLTKRQYRRSNPGIATSDRRLAIVQWLGRHGSDAKTSIPVLNQLLQDNSFNGDPRQSKTSLGKIIEETIEKIENDKR